MMAAEQSAPASRRRRTGIYSSSFPHAAGARDDGDDDDGENEKDRRNDCDDRTHGNVGGGRKMCGGGGVKRRSILMLAFVILLCATSFLWLFVLIDSSSIPRRRPAMGRATIDRPRPPPRGKRPDAVQTTSAIKMPSTARAPTHRRAIGGTRPPTRAPTHKFDCARIPSSHRRRTREGDDLLSSRGSSSSSSSSSSSNQNQTLAVISVCIPGDRFDDEYINASLSNKRRYCDRWGATCILSRERMPQPGGATSSDRHGINTLTKLHNRQSGTTTTREYSPKWEKLLRITETMYTIDVDWLLWIDCDAAFTNFDVDWRVHLADHLDASNVLVTSQDRAGINLGVFLLPNTPYARFFVELMSEERHDIERRGLSHKDQSALKNLLAKSPQLACSIDDGVPQGMMNSYLDNPDGHQWTPDDWIAHQVFCESKDCPKRFLSFLKSLDPDP